MHKPAMNRRQALRALALGGVGAAAVPAWVTALEDVAVAHTTPQAAAAWTPAVLSQQQHDTVVTLAELIIPKTDTADAGVTRFIDTVLEDAPAAERERFLGGLAWLDSRCQELFGSTFDDAAPNEQTVSGSLIQAQTVAHLCPDTPAICEETQWLGGRRRPMTAGLRSVRVRAHPPGQEEHHRAAAPVRALHAHLQQEIEALRGRHLIPRHI